MPTLTGTETLWVLGQNPANVPAASEFQCTTLDVANLAETASFASGTFTANQTTPVVVANAAVTADSVISIGLKTVGGTPAAIFFSAAIVPGVSFTINSAASNTSIYNYKIIG